MSFLSRCQIGRREGKGKAPNVDACAVNLGGKIRCLTDEKAVTVVTIVTVVTAARSNRASIDLVSERLSL